MLTGVVYKTKSGPSTEPCETLYDSETLSVRVSVIVISRPTKLVRGINVTSDFRPPSVCISFPKQISETYRGVFFILHTHIHYGVYKRLLGYMNFDLLK